MSLSAPIRVFVAGSQGSVLTDAAMAMLHADPRVQVVGLTVDRTSRAQLEAAAPDLLVSAAHSHMIPGSLLRVARLGSIGLHPSKLPRNRGSYPLWWALCRGYADTALTVFHLEPTVDSGPILEQRVVEICTDDTFATLYKRVAAEVAPALTHVIDEIATTGALPAGRPQDASLVVRVLTPPRWRRGVMRLYWGVRRIAYRALGLGSRPRRMDVHRTRPLHG